MKCEPSIITFMTGRYLAIVSRGQRYNETGGGGSQLVRDVEMTSALDRVTSCEGTPDDGTVSRHQISDDETRRSTSDAPFTAVWR